MYSRLMVISSSPTVAIHLPNKLIAPILLYNSSAPALNYKPYGVSIVPLNVRIRVSILLNGNNTTAILVPRDFAQRFDYYFDRNYLSLLVAYGSKYVTQYNQEARLTPGDMFSAIGGQTGL
jgi:hypothetical protein